MAKLTADEAREKGKWWIKVVVKGADKVNARGESTAWLYHGDSESPDRDPTEGHGDPDGDTAYLAMVRYAVQRSDKPGYVPEPDDASEQAPQPTPEKYDVATAEEWYPRLTVNEV